MVAMTTSLVSGRSTLSGLRPRPHERLPEGALRAVLAGVEAAVFGWLCMVVPAIAGYVATAAAPALGDATWFDAAAVGTGVWRLAHGGALTAAGATVAVVPLGLSVLAAGLVTVSVRRARVSTWTGVAGAVLGYTVVAAVLAALVPTAVGGAWRTLAGATLVGAVGALVAVRRRGGALPAPHEALTATWSRVPRVVRSVLLAGTRGAGVTLAVLLLLGGLLVAVSLAANLGGFTDTIASLRTNALGVVMVLLVGALLLPCAAVWAVAWVAGPGFAVGEGTLVAPDAVVPGPVPALPLLAALPGPSPLGGWTALAVVAVGGLGGWYLHRRRPQPGAWPAAASAVVAALLCGTGAAFLAAAAGGPVGPGRMVQVGPDPAAVGLAVTALVGLGALLVVTAARPESVARARRVLARTASLVPVRRPAVRSAGG